MTAVQAGFALRGRNPDVLTCIANLSNDEVFTPPDFANQMLDTLTDAWAASHNGENLWADPTVRFLDPCTKSGVFLREITSRLTVGLVEAIPDLEERVDHILTTQVYGLAITHLTSLLARRSLYCSKWANGPHSIAKSFDGPDGNIWFERTEHTWAGGTDRVLTADEHGNPVERTRDGKCVHCGAGQRSLDRGAGFETHAYAFIHTDDITARIAELFGDDMQFDVIVGNPPYQLDDGGFGTSAAPIYQKFVESALALEPRYVVMVTPSRWFAGGKGLADYRERMLGDRRVRALVDFPKLYDGFPGVKIRGGISYFLWDRSHDGPCTVQTMWDGEPVGPPVDRYLDAHDVLVRWNQAVSILDKVQSRGEATLDSRVSSRKPFGLPTNFHGQPEKAGLPHPVKLYGSQRVSYVDREAVPGNTSWIDDWKVLMTAVQGTSAAVETKFLSRPIVAGPGTACTETYLVAGRFGTEREATQYATYLRTRFVRFLVSLRKQTQHATRDVYSFVPDLSVEEEWTDLKLYERYGLTKSEIAFVESQVAEHDDVPAQGVTHLVADE